jgi:glucokinase
MPEGEVHMACLDIGGTSIKSALVGTGGALVEPSLLNDPIDSGGSAESIKRAFLGAAQRLMDYAQKEDIRIWGIGVSICGPFDYERGISKIKGLDKYEAIYGLNVKELFREGLHLGGDFPIFFDIDSWSFARGEVLAGAGRPYGRVIVLTLGTGVGSAFAVDGKIVSEGSGVPWLGWISGQAFKGGILNDYISRTYMIRRFKEINGIEIDIKEMVIKADAGDANARRVFVEMGEVLGGFLRDHNVAEFGAECLVLGGQISKSCHLFIDTLRKELSGITSLKAIVRAADIERSALKGISFLLFEKAEMSKRECHASRPVQ